MTYESQFEEKINLSKLSKAKAKKIIAQDVIAALRLKRIKAENNGYFSLNLGSLSEKYNGIQKVEFQKILTKAKKPCSVCAIGSCLVAVVRRENKFKVDVSDGRVRGDRHDHEEFLERLNPWFPRKELAIMEAAFEKDSTSPVAKDIFEELRDEGKKLDKFKNKVEKAVIFGDKYEDKPDKLLKAIMKNVIKNGKFMP